MIIFHCYALNCCKWQNNFCKWARFFPVFWGIISCWDIILSTCRIQVGALDFKVGCSVLNLNKKGIFIFIWHIKVQWLFFDWEQSFSAHILCLVLSGLYSQWGCGKNFTAHPVLISLIFFYLFRTESNHLKTSESLPHFSWHVVRDPEVIRLRLYTLCQALSRANLDA